MRIKFKRDWNYGLLAIFLLWVFALLMGAPIIMSIALLVLIVLISLARDFDCQINDEEVLISKPFNPFYEKKIIKWLDIKKVEYYKSDIALKGPMVNDYFNFYLKGKENFKIRADGLFSKEDLADLVEFCKQNNVEFTII